VPAAEPPLQLDEVLPPLHVLEQLAAVGRWFPAGEARQHAVPLEQLPDFLQSLVDAIIGLHAANDTASLRRCRNAGYGQTRLKPRATTRLKPRATTRRVVRGFSPVFSDEA
jgi:hypothetical protein